MTQLVAVGGLMNGHVYGAGVPISTAPHLLAEGAPNDGSILTTEDGKEILQEPTS